MRLLIVVALAVTPAMFGQARGGARTGGPARRTVGGTPQVAAPRAPMRAIGGVVPGAYLPGYYPNFLYYGGGYVDPSVYANGYAPPAPPPDGGPAGGPPPAYYGADPGGQGYPSVLINPNYVPETAQPLMRDYSYLPPTQGDTAAQPSPQASVFFLIAMKDHTIYPAVAYWVENDTLNYISQQGVRNQVPLGQVDRDFSVQLNKERNIDFALPNPKTN